MKVACRDGDWVVGAKLILLLNAHLNQEHPLTLSLEMFWTFSVRNHSFCPGMAKAGSWEQSICGNGSGAFKSECLKWLSTLNTCSQSWFSHRCLWWHGQQRGPWDGGGALSYLLGVSSFTPRPFLRVPLLPSLQNGDSDASAAFAKSFERLVFLLQTLHEI